MRARQEILFVWWLVDSFYISSFDVYLAGWVGIVYITEKKTFNTKKRETNGKSKEWRNLR